MKRGQAYDPELDRKQRVKELRVVYEARMQEREMGKREEREDDDEGSEITKGLHTYFTSKSERQVWTTLFASRGLVYRKGTFANE